MPEDSSHFIAEAELPRIQKRYKDRLGFVTPEHTVRREQLAFSGRNVNCGNSIFRTRSTNAGLNCGSPVVASARPNTCAMSVGRRWILPRYPKRAIATGFDRFFREYGQKNWAK